MDNFNQISSQDFYNTIYLDADQWKEENEKAKGMQRLVKYVCQTNATIKVSGWLMKRYLERTTERKANINSIRRCLSNLKNEGHLLLLTSTRIGEESKLEHYYIWKEGNQNREDIKTEKFEVPSVEHFATKIMQIGKQSKLEL